MDSALSTDGALGVPVQCREWDQKAFRGPFQLQPFHDSMEKGFFFLSLPPQNLLRVVSTPIFP